MRLRSSWLSRAVSASRRSACSSCAQLSSFRTSIVNGVLYPVGATGWRLNSGAESLRLRGKNLFIPQLLLLHRPVFRRAWHSEQLVMQVREDWTAKRHAYGALAPVVYGSAVSIFVLLPYALLLDRRDAVLLLAVGWIYAHAVWAAAALLIKRNTWGLSTRRALMLGLECLLCPPITLNLVRRLSLAEVGQDDLVSAARALLDAPDWDAARGYFVAQLDAELEEAVAHSEAAQALQRSRDTLMENPQA